MTRAATSITQIGTGPPPMFTIRDPAGNRLYIVHCM